MNFKTSIFTIATGAMAIASAQAATISWTANNITAGNGTADVSTAGTLVDARNGNNSDVTVNGVTFLSVATGSTAAGYNLFDSLFAIDAIGARAGTNPSGTYYTFLTTGQRSGRNGFDGTFTGGYPRTSPANVWATVNFSGLTIGNTYQVQIWHTDTNTTLGDAGNAGLLLGNGAAGNPNIATDTMLLREVSDGATASVYGTGGQFGLGTFVADASTQSFNVRAYSNLLTTPSAASSDHYSNGWQIRDLGVIPEPSAALLGALGMLLLLRRRR